MSCVVSYVRIGDRRSKVYLRRNSNQFYIFVNRMSTHSQYFFLTKTYTMKQTRYHMNNLDFKDTEHSAIAKWVNCWPILRWVVWITITLGMQSWSHTVMLSALLADRLILRSGLKNLYCNKKFASCMVCKLLFVSYNANHAFARFVGYGEKVLIEQEKSRSPSTLTNTVCILSTVQRENRTLNLLAFTRAS